ncbi:MAG: hypothetical protein HY344_01010 [Candidatus Levybacteria bacterium]|nr:hypothetical protein [Candidatus Levybacteria bacterium]
MKILIITGGNSSERPVSLNSARNVKKTFIQNGHKVKLYDLRNGYLPIKKVSKDFDVLFPVLHGEEGEGGKLHKFLASINKPIVGTRNYKGLKGGWYKIPFKKYCDKNGIKTPKWKIVKNKNDILKFGIPCVLKTSNGGSSREVAIIKTKDDLNRADVKKILSFNTPTFVEEYLKGYDITVGILNKKALPIIEIVPTKDTWFSYKVKYDNTTKEIPFAPSLDKGLQEKIQDLTLRIHNAFDLGTYSRTDFMVYKDIPYAIDVNTIPGLTEGSLLPKEAKAVGLSFNEFLEILIKKAV